jgi:hypothetical protein
VYEEKEDRREGQQRINGDGGIENLDRYIEPCDSKITRRRGLNRITSQTIIQAK